MGQKVKRYLELIFLALFISGLGLSVWLYFSSQPQGEEVIGTGIEFIFLLAVSLLFGMIALVLHRSIRKINAR